MSEKGTEQASPQRKQKAKEQGDIVRSRELTSAVAMLAGTMALGWCAQGFIRTWRSVYVECLRLGLDSSLNQDALWRTALRQVFAPVMASLAMVLAASFAGAVVTGMAQGGGLSLHPNALSLKLERLNPITNLGNIFSLRGATRVTKSLVPATVMVILAWSALRPLMLSMPVMSLMRLPATFSVAYGLLLDAAWITLAWSALDYAIEWRSWSMRLRMTKQELRQEMKDTMGNPEIKGRIRQIQRAMRRRRVKADISRASVVITNPTHYAVALEFSFETMQAPTVLTKGRDLHAAEIREEARWAGVPVIENPPLARSLYRSVEPGQVIPYELYAAVAGILAFLYRQKVEEKMREERRRTSQSEIKEANPHNKVGGGLNGAI